MSRRFLIALVVALAAPSAAGAAPPGVGQIDPLPSDAMKLGIFQPAGQQLLSSNTYYGLRHTDRWFDMLVTDTSGTYYLTTNAIGRPSADAPLQVLPPLHPGLPAGFASSPAGMIPNLCNRPWVGDVSEELTQDDHITSTVADVGGTEQLTFGPQHFSWSSPGYVDLHGTLASPGINWYLPSTYSNGSPDPIYYLAQYYAVDGTYCGHDVHGYVYVENMWGAEDYSDTTWVKNRAGHWIFWTNEYDDGTREYGQFLCGEFGARGAAVADSTGRQVLNTSQINAVQQTDAAGNTTRIDYRFGDGEHWEYTGDPSRNIPIGATGTSLGGGIVQRVGETRKIVRHDAVQLVAKHMCAHETLKPPARLRLIVRPKHIRAGRRTRVRFRVAPAQPGVVIRFAGRRVTTDPRGRASVVVRLRHAGRRLVRAGAARGIVHVRRRIR
jgi:hypothetical protein